MGMSPEWEVSLHLKYVQMLCNTCLQGQEVREELLPASERGREGRGQNPTQPWGKPRLKPRC